MNDFDLLDKLYPPPAHMDRLEVQNQRQRLKEYEAYQAELHRQLEEKEARDQKAENAQHDQETPPDSNQKNEGLTPMERALLEKLGPRTD